MRMVAILAPLFMVAGCSPGPDATDQTPAADPAPSRSAAASGSIASPDAPVTTLPPSGAVPRYVGRWAARADLCEGGAWTFTEDGAGLEDGPSCQFESVTEIPGGYRIATTCEQGGKASRGTATLRFAESARGMLVENLATLPDTGLVYCGPAANPIEGETR